MARFDNRTPLRRLGLDLGQRVIDRVRGQGALHLICKVGDKTIGYCYIRKNACSSFKKLFIEMSGQIYNPAEHPRKIDFLIEHQMMRTADAPRCDHIIFVYRDPVERIVSLYKNKFIVRDGHEDIFRSYAETVGEAPGGASFRHFVERYLARDLRRLDPHVLPQSAHLKRFLYTDAIAMDALHPAMASILGPAIADRYFRSPVNATSDIEAQPVPDAPDRTADALAETWRSGGVLPRTADFLDPGLVSRLRALYAADVALVARLGAGGAGARSGAA